MASWRELAAAAAAKAPSTSDPIAPAAQEDWGLDHFVVTGLLRLEVLPPPARVNSRGVWAKVVRDALHLAREGWAAKALALGWDATDLFATGGENSDQRDCLAVWLSGRNIVALTEWTARTDCGAWFSREAHMRPNSPRATPVWLWDFGRRH